MSDYVQAKVIRLPFPKVLLDMFNTKDPYDCEEYLREKLDGLYGPVNGRKGGYFEIEGTDKAFYIDYVLQTSYGEGSGDFGISFRLNPNDYEKYLPLFKKLDVPFSKSELRKVMYSYYNCCECKDYYIPSADIFDEL